MDSMTIFIRMDGLEYNWNVSKSRLFRVDFSPFASVSFYGAENNIMH